MGWAALLFLEASNSIQILGDTQDNVYKAQSDLNVMFFPPEVKSKKAWARPDKPGQWGQRRDVNRKSMNSSRMSMSSSSSSERRGMH